MTLKRPVLTKAPVGGLPVGGRLSALDWKMSEMLKTFQHLAQSWGWILARDSIP